MPPQNLPKHAKEIYTAAEESARKSTCKDAGERMDECTNRVAWAAVKAKYKKVGDEWVPKAELAEFSLRIERASHDKETGELRWSAVASDTDEDSFSDNMTLELFNSFMQRIESEERPPEQFRSDFWDGGIPYLSVAHYPDLDGKAVPGPVDSVYIDGNYLKSKGKFDKTELGWACYNAVFEDLYSKKRSDAEDKVRISIAFLDYKHKHKSNGFVFERKSIDDWCPECFKSMFDGNGSGKEYLDGHLIHLALTRVPVNKRTGIEVERAMTTRKEDAASIIGEDQADELEEEAKLIGKSEALVVKSKEKAEHMMTEDEMMEECRDEDGEVDEDCMKRMKARKKAKHGKQVISDEGLDEELNDEDDDEEDEEEAPKKKVKKSEAVIELAVTKKERGCENPSSHYLVVEDPEKPTTWHLPIKNCSGEYDHRLMGAAKAALTKGYRGNKYEGPKKAQALAKLKRAYKAEDLDFNTKSEVEMEIEELEELRAEIAEIKSAVIKSETAHPLDEVIITLKSAYDAALKSANPKESLDPVEQALQAIGQKVMEAVNATDTSQVAGQSDLVAALSAAMKPVYEKLALFEARLSEVKLPVKNEVPPRRSIDPAFLMQGVQPEKRSSLTELVRKSVGLQS